MPTYTDVIDRASNTAIEVPEQVASDVIQAVSGTSVVAGLARTVRMSSKTYRQPVLDVLPNAYWVNGDTGLKQTTTQGWENVYMTAEPIAALVVIPDEFLDDATLPIWSEVRPRIAAAFGRLIDNAALWNISRPSSWSHSIYPEAVAAGNYIEAGQGGTGKTDLAYDVAQMGLQLANDGFSLDGFASQPGFQWKLVGQRTSTGEPIYTTLIGENRQGLYGKPFLESNNGAWKSTVQLIGGEWDKAILGIRQDITYTMHTDAIISDGSGNVVFNAMQQDSKIMRVVGRFAFAVANPVTDINTNSATRYPFSILADNDTAGS
jgi:HK97 family phage major capsid protein